MSAGLRQVIMARIYSHLCCLASQLCLLWIDFDNLNGLVGSVGIWLGVAAHMMLLRSKEMERMNRICDLWPSNSRTTK